MEGVRGGFNDAFVMSQCLGVCPPINIGFFEGAQRV